MPRLDRDTAPKKKTRPFEAGRISTTPPKPPLNNHLRTPTNSWELLGTPDPIRLFLTATEWQGWW
jgi:hypothetical protein